MDKLHYSIRINAPAEKVWNTMTSDATYREWTSVWSEGSHFVGDWSEGSKILFLAPDKNGKMGGMVSRIKEVRPYEYISIEHLGVMENGEEDTTSENVKPWAGALENYTLVEADGKTEVKIDLDAWGDDSDMFNSTWPKALEKLKTIAEQ